ncbi:MAG: T9SS type A sorting domain-containing protein [Bacteroidota bacterium]
MKRHLYVLALAFLFLALPYGAHAQTAPGGVSTNLDLWLKADAGVTESVGAVSAWADQSTNSNNATQASGTLQPMYVANGLNFNPALLFDGTDDYLDTALDINAGTAPDATIFAVYRTTAAAAGPVWGEFDGSGDRLIRNHSGTDGEVGYGPTFDTALGLFPTDVPTIGTVQFDEDAASGSYVFGNGTQLLQFTADQDPTTSNTFEIGGLGDDGVGGVFNGEIYEVVVHSQVMTTQEMHEVESYLAIKYGITLGHDYFASDGTVVRALGGTYDFHIAAIGRDDASGLNQKQTMSSEAGAFVTIALGSYAADNASNVNTFSSDLQFLAWADDNGSTLLTEAFAGTSTNRRMAREWKVKEVNGVGTVEVRIPNAYGATYLISDDNASFTSPDETLLSDNGDGTSSATINFSNGDFFTFGANMPAPGGVASNLALWLKSDAGVTESAGDISVWADQSGNARDAAANGVSNLPAFAASDLNYNPIVAFDASNSEGLNTPSVFENTAHSNVNIFVVAQHNTLSDSWLFIEQEVGQSDRVSAHVPFNTLSTIYWDAGTTSGDFRLSAAWSESVGTPYLWGFEYESATPKQAIYRDGNLVSTDASVSSFTFPSINDFQLANNVPSSDYNDSDIAELIVFTGAVSDAEQLQIDTYLALKYGLQLDNNYVASDATLLWDPTANAIYHNDVAGIGRDDASGLNQKQSVGGIMAASRGSLAADNPSNGNSFASDKSFLFWGHDTGALTESTVMFGSSPAQLLGRKWLVKETGNSGSLELQFDLNGATVSGSAATDFWLVVDTDTDPTNGSRILQQANSFTAGVASFTGVVLEDDDILMLITDNPDDVTLPVEMTQFDAVFDNGSVQLVWTTASEVNNAGFEVQRRVTDRDGATGWLNIGFVKGQGTSDTAHTYTFKDAARGLRASRAAYRIKQVDFNGDFRHSEVAEVYLPAPEAYDMSSYPNPFNPVATISYDVPVDGHIKLAVYDAQGRMVKVLVDGQQAAGRYSASFDGSGLASGVYVYRLEAAGKSFSKTMMLVK